MLKTTRGSIVLGLYLIIFLCLSLFPEFFSSSLRRGIDLCLQSLIPALFPHLFLSSFFIKSGGAACLGQRLGKLTKHLFRLHENSVTALLLGNLSGYPTGAKTIAALYKEKQISRQDAQRLLFFSCNAGPGFIFGAVGGAIYRSAAVGISLFFIHLISSLLCGLLLPAVKEVFPVDSAVVRPRKALSQSFVESVADASATMGKICAFICLFSLLICGEEALLGRFEEIYSVAAGLTELSSGCYVLAESSLPWTMKFTFTAAFLGFGGFCVMAQTMAVLSGTGLSLKPYLKGKLLHGIFSALLAWPVSYFINPAASAGAQTILLQPVSPLPWRFLSLGMVFLIFLQFPSGNPQRNQL